MHCLGWWTGFLGFVLTMLLFGTVVVCVGSVG